MHTHVDAHLSSLVMYLGAFALLSNLDFADPLSHVLIKRFLIQVIYSTLTPH